MNKTTEKKLVLFATLLTHCFFAVASDVIEDAKPRILNIAEAEAVVVAMQNDAADHCKARQCVVIVSSEDAYSKVTFANKVDYDIGNNQKAYRYINGVTLYVNNVSKQVDKVVSNR